MVRAKWSLTWFMVRTVAQRRTPSAWLQQSTRVHISSYFGIMDVVLSKHLKQQADVEEYAVILELACGARIGELVWLANFEEVDGKPEYVKRVRKIFIEFVRFLLN